MSSKSRTKNMSENKNVVDGMKARIIPSGGAQPD